jgi:hypothetical protein
MESRARHWAKSGAKSGKNGGTGTMKTMKRTGGALALAVAAVLAAAVPPVAAGVMTGNCRLGNQPAATLLVPYFRTDLNNPNGETTLFAVNNASAKPALARVVLWTDWGVPTLAFDIYLTGYDVQTLNVRSLLTGTLPTTGGDHSPEGQFSTPPSDATSAADACVTPRSTLRTAERAYLRAAHSGQPLPATGANAANAANAAGGASCAGSASGGPVIATGYITVDLVNRCTATTVGQTENTPADPTYFAHGGAGLASDDNVLWGDYYFMDPKTGQSDSQTAVAIVADPDFFTAGSYTFYGRYVNFTARDDRMPLSSLYYTRFTDGGALKSSTDLVVWRDNRDVFVAPSSCAKGPRWAPLGEEQLVAFDEEENAAQVGDSNAFPLATQRVHVRSAAIPTPMSQGWLMLDLWHKDGTHAQGWVTAMLSSGGRFNAGHEAVRVDDLCNFGP